MRDCTLVAVATGRRAQNLRELRDHIATVHPDSIYYHFWGGLLRPRFDDPEFNNDFAAWARDGLNEHKLAERLGVIDPTDFLDLEALRLELVEVIEDHLDENEYVPWTNSDRQFHFIRSKIVVFDTSQRIEKPEMLPHATESMSSSSIFYHFIDARRRTPDRIDDFSTWLRGYGDKYRKLHSQLSAIDPYFATLVELRDKITRLFFDYFGDKIEKLPA
ncbi:MAG: DUF5752 family protein [Candidatus Glassbacteria bacterium]